MTIPIEMGKYMGVLCHSCTQPIPVPQKVMNRAHTSEDAREIRTGVANLRCRVCEKEDFYRLSEVVEMHGTPKSLTTRARLLSAHMRNQQKQSGGLGGR
jgi:hypothetical protein